MYRIFNNSSWYPLKNFTSSGCHRDWMMGATKFFNSKDTLTGKKIPANSTVFWNRSLNANVALDTYNEVRANKNPDLLKRCEELGLPMDIKV